MKTLRLSTFSLAFLAISAQATPWLDTQDNYLRQSLQTLSHAGLISGPVNTYPLMWKNIAKDLADVPNRGYSEEVTFALAHIRKALNVNESDKTAGVKVKANTETMGIQSFGETYTEEGSLTVFSEFQNNIFAGRSEVHYRKQKNGSTEQDLTYDNSYLAALLGNWVLSVDQISTWWGPGQQSALLQSNNARPLPSVRLSRHGWDAVDLPVLNWLGPWSFTTFIGLGEHQSPISQPRYWGGRFNFRPATALELGLSRVSQWGGQGKNNGIGDWWDMVLNKEDASDNTDQRVAFDLSYHFNLLERPFTAYAELADDDNAKGLPDTPLLLAGVRSYWGNSSGIHTVNLEYSDTYIDCPDTVIKGNCAYQGDLYSQGYTRYGRVIGSGYGKDARVLSGGYHYQTYDGISWSGHVYLADYYDTTGNSEQSWQVKAEHRRPVFNGLLSLQFRYLEKSPLLVAGADQFGAATTWEYRF